MNYITKYQPTLLMSRELYFISVFPTLRYSAVTCTYLLDNAKHWIDPIQATCLFETFLTQAISISVTCKAIKRDNICVNI